MTTDRIKNDFFDVIKHGYVWHSKKIKEELERLVLLNPIEGNRDLLYDKDEKYYYMYDNECYLFVLDDEIEVRCDRENVFSSYNKFTHQIKEAKDVLTAYENFNSITLEDDKN